MDKKNTMLLTVIAVATLLVAVVGATFAYFSVNAGDESVTNATVTTPKIGTVSLANVHPTLSLTLTAEDMAKSNENNVYYATVDGNSQGNSNPIPIIKADLSGAQDQAKYICETTVKVTASGEMLDKLSAGWATLKLTGNGVSNSEEADSIDLFTLKDASDGKTYTGTATLTASSAGSASENILNAVLSFTNTTDDQSEIAGKTLTVTVNVTGGKCTLQAE